MSSATANPAPSGVEEGCAAPCAGRVVLIDGALVAPAQATVSVFDRGFLFGDSVFEVLRTYGGKPFALAEHLARLRRSAERVFITLPVEDAVLAREVECAIGATGHDESYVRVIVTRGVGPLSLDPDTAARPTRVILVDRVAPPPRTAYADGIAVALVATQRATDGTGGAGAKVGSYLANLLALRQAKASGAQEALIVDARGHVVEGASSNVFVVAAGRVITPPETEGILAGITRAHVLGAARALGIAVIERPLSPDEIRAGAADEVFITSSIRELVPVVRVDGATIGGGRPGPVSRALHRRFRTDLGLGAAPMPWEVPPSR